MEKTILTEKSRSKLSNKIKLQGFSKKISEMCHKETPVYLLGKGNVGVFYYEKKVKFRFLG